MMVSSKTKLIINMKSCYDDRDQADFLMYYKMESPASCDQCNLYIQHKPNNKNVLYICIIVLKLLFSQIEL